MTNSRFQFGLKTLIVVALLVCAATAFIVSKYENQSRFREINTRLQRLERHSQLVDELSELRIEFGTAKDRLGENHPTVKSLKGHVERISRLIQDAEIEMNGKTFKMVPKESTLD